MKVQFILTDDFFSSQKRPGMSGTIAYTIVPTIGALDLGGASTQITFIPQDPSEVPPDYSQVTRLFGSNYSVYTHSYLCYGIMEVTGRAFAALVKVTIGHVMEFQSAFKL